MTFDDIRAHGDWQPIRSCPGRFVLRSATPTPSLADLLGDDVVRPPLHPANARDLVFVAQLDEGGLISYLRRDGRWVHTLSTSEGFRRKLNQLEIEPNITSRQGCCNSY